MAIYKTPCIISIVNFIRSTSSLQHCLFRQLLVDTDAEHTDLQHQMAQQRKGSEPVLWTSAGDRDFPGNVSTNIGSYAVRADNERKVPGRSPLSMWHVWTTEYFESRNTVCRGKSICVFGWETVCLQDQANDLHNGLKELKIDALSTTPYIHDHINWNTRLDRLHDKVRHVRVRKTFGLAMWIRISSPQLRKWPCKF